MAHAAEAYPDPWGLPSMHLKQTFASMAHAAEAYPDPWGLPSIHLKQTIASMAHAAEAYPDPWGLPRSLGLTQHAFKANICQHGACS